MPHFPLANANRLYSYETLAHLVDGLLSRFDQDRSYALFLVDHDTLDAINQAFGREVGDAVIEHTAEVLPAVFRATDLVARTYEDEFIVFMKDISSLDTIECIAGLVLQLLRCPCGTAEHTVEATVTIGIAMAQNASPRSFNDLYDNACSALRQAKTSKVHRFFICDGEGKPVQGTYGFDRLISASTPNLLPFLETIDNGGVLLRAKSENRLVPQYFSDSFLKLLGGMSRDEALRVYGDDILAGVHPTDRPRVTDEIAEAYSSGTPLRTIARLRAVQGDYIWTSICMTWVRDENGLVDAYATHASMESVAQHYDYAANNTRTAKLGLALYMFSVTFADGEPDGFSVYDREGKRLGGIEGENLADALLSSGIVHPDSETALQEFYARILRTDRHGGMLVLVNGPEEGVLHWARISYSMAYDEQGRPLRATGNICELPHTVDEQGKFFREAKLFDIVAPRLLGGVRCNLSTEEIEGVYPPNPLSEGARYDSFLSSALLRFCYADDAVDLANALSREGLMSLVERGIYQLTREFRREESGRIRWTSVTARIMEEPKTRHLTAFLYVSDIERRYAEMAFASSMVRPDEATGLYCSGTIERAIAALQHADTPDNPLAAIAVVRVAMPSDLRSMVTAEDATAGQVYLGQQLAVCLAQEGLVARSGADGFLLFFPRVDSENWLRRLIERAVSDLRAAYVDSDGKRQSIVLACGFSIGPLRDIRFEDAVKRARNACRTNEAEEGGSVWSFDERMVILRDEMERSDGRAFHVIGGEELERPLTGTEAAALDEAMKAMLLSETYDMAVENVLRIVGQLYRAHRVFTVALMESGVVSGLHEWHEPGAQPIIGQVMGRTVKEYGVLVSALNAEAPVVMERQQAIAERIEGLASRTWSFIAFPVKRSGLVTGFLCVEDPHAFRTNVALLVQLAPLMQSQRARMGAVALSPNSRTRDALTGLPNRLAFERNVVTFDPTLFHSVGVLRVALDRSYTLDGDRDRKNEESALMYAARNLCGMFPLDTVYSTGDLEVTCVCTNMSYDSFNARCTRMVAIMRQRSRSGFALCDAWSDSMTPLSKLLDEAATSVYGDRSILFPNEHARGLGAMPSVQRAFDGDSFSIRLQPQVDLATGEVVGSEALARCTSATGESIPPSEFVPRMEAEGDIAELDYFVLEKTLSAMEDWKERGLKVLPISVNFSRQTVMESNFVASVLAIASRYDIPENLLEIEITESMGAFKSVELRMAMETLRGQGFRFALDDLGSEYSTLSTMSELPFDTVKLDRMLVKRFIDDSVGRSIVEGIAHACEKNGIRCIAEGVEQESYIKPLIDLGCHYGQGYCFARPMTVDQFTKEYLIGSGGGAERGPALPPSN